MTSELFLQVAGLAVHIQCAEPSVERTLRAAWAPALRLPPSPPAAQMLIDETGAWFVDGVLKKRDEHVEDRISQIEFFLIRDLLERRKTALHLHAACVLLQGKVFLFVGESGAGKSTFTRQAVKRGGQYLSDDCVVIEAGEAKGVARTIQFDAILRDEGIPPHLLDCDVESYQSVSSRGKRRRVPLWNHEHTVIESLPVKQYEWIVVELHRDAKDAVSKVSAIERLAALHAATVTVGTTYANELGLGRTFALGWQDPEKAFALLLEHLSL